MNLHLGYPRFVLGFFLLFSLLAFWGCESGPSDSETGNTEEAFYPIDFCVVTGNDFDEDGSGMIPYSHVHEGITIKFCCKKETICRFSRRGRGRQTVGYGDTGLTFPPTAGADEAY